MAKTMDRVATPKASRSEATRGRLVDEARRLFGELGYAATSVDEIVRAAGVTKGALYHHFRDKDDLFRAVVEAVKGEATAVAGASFLDEAADQDPMRRLCVLCLALIDAYSDPAAQRIAVVDARAVLEPATRRDLDTRYEVSLVRGAFRSAMRTGQVRRVALAPLAQIVTGAVFEGCALIEGAEDKATTRGEVSDVISALLYGLQTPSVELA